MCFELIRWVHLSLQPDSSVRVLLRVPPRGFFQTRLSVVNSPIRPAGLSNPHGSQLHRARLTTQAQRPGPRGRLLATWTRMAGSLQRLVRPRVLVNAHTGSGQLWVKCALTSPRSQAPNSANERGPHVASDGSVLNARQCGRDPVRWPPRNRPDKCHKRLAPPT